VAVARGGRERQPAQGSFLTAAEGQRRVLPRGFRFLAGPLSTCLGHVRDGLTSPRSVPTTHDLQERAPLLAKRIRSR